MFQPNWDDPSKTKGVALVDKSLEPGTKLYTHPASADNSGHWAAQSPGLADQYRQEAFAAREATGFSCDSLEVSPADIRQAIADNQAVSVPEWIKCSDRLPAEYDGDFEGLVWVNDRDMTLPKYAQSRLHWSRVRVIDGYTHWMPTGFRRPQPPKQEDE
jgi:hypothetical protein